MDIFRISEQAPERHGSVSLTELLLCLLALLPGADTFSDIANFGNGKVALTCAGFGHLRQAGHRLIISAILAKLDAEAFQRCFVGWVALLTGVATDVIANNGKTMRRSQRAIAAIHMVSTHNDAEDQGWLARRLHWHVHSTPTPASWINQVERWCAELTGKQLQRVIH